MMFFKDSEFDSCPMNSAEALHWLTKGRTIFRHNGMYLMRLVKANGTRSLIEIPDRVIESLNINLVERIGITIRAKQEFLYD